MKSLVICSSQRTGSTLIGALLRDCGVVAGGEEFFEVGFVMPETVLPVIGMASVAEARADVDRYVERIVRHWAPSDGQYFVVKVHWFQFQQWVPHGLDLVRHFPGARYLFCTRGDVLKQAISAVKANQTLSWTSQQKPRRDPVYDFDALTHEVRKLLDEQAQWERYFSTNGIQPFRLAYETLDRDYQAVVGHLNTWLALGLSSRQLRKLKLPPMERQSDQVNASWEERYYADLGARP